MLFLTCKRIYIYCLALAATFFIVASPAMAKNKPLLIAVDSPYPPFAYEDEAGNLAGFDVDIANALCKAMERECEVKIVEFENIIPSIVAGEVDLGLAGMGATDERKKYVDFTDRYFRSHSIFIEKPDAVKEISIEALKDKRIGTQSGTIQEKYLLETYGDIATIIAEIGYEEVFDALQNNKSDIILVDGLSGYEYLKSEKGKGLETIGDPIHSSTILDASCIAVSKNNPKLREEVNKAIQTIRQNGEYDKINRKYFDFNVY